MSEHPDNKSVAGKCPACGGRYLFRASGGYITCSLDVCPDPTAVSDWLERDHTSFRRSGIDPQRILDYAHSAVSTDVVTISWAVLATLAYELGAKDASE